MTRYAVLVVAGLGAVSLAGCLTTSTPVVPSWQSFDACSEQTSFHDWVACGKANREATCAAGNCSSGPNANTVMAYVDSLDQAVLRHEMSESEARAKWLKFRNERELAQEAARSQSARLAQDRATFATSKCGSAISC